MFKIIKKIGEHIYIILACFWLIIGIALVIALKINGATDDGGIVIDVLLFSLIFAVLALVEKQVKKVKEIQKKIDYLNEKIK